MFSEVKLHVEGAYCQSARGGDIVEDATRLGLLSPIHKAEKLQIDPCLMCDLPLALGSNDVARSRAILPELCKLIRPDYSRFLEAFYESIAGRQGVRQHIHKYRRPPMPWFGDDSEGEREDEDEKGGDGEEDEGEGDGEDEQEQGTSEFVSHMASDLTLGRAMALDAAPSSVLTMIGGCQASGID